MHYKLLTVRRWHLSFSMSQWNWQSVLCFTSFSTRARLISIQQSIRSKNIKDQLVTSGEACGAVLDRCKYHITRSLLPHNKTRQHQSRFEQNVSRNKCIFIVWFFDCRRHRRHHQHVEFFLLSSRFVLISVEKCIPFRVHLYFASIRHRRICFYWESALV